MITRVPLLISKTISARIWGVAEGQAIPEKCENITKSKNNNGGWGGENSSLSLPKIRYLDF